MSVIELRTWDTTEGIDIPFYKLPYSRSELYGAVDEIFGTQNLVYTYPNYGSGKLIDNPYLDDIRWIARKTFEGWNPKNALAFETAGYFSFLTADGPTGPSYDHIPGTARWDDKNTWEGLSSPGSRAPGWVGTGFCQVRPFPDEYFVWENAFSSFGLATAMVQTSDNSLVLLYFQEYLNFYGWQSWAVTRSEVSPDEIPNPTNFLSKLVEKSDDKGEDTVARFNPRTATSTIGCYVMTKNHVREFLNDLWTTTAVDAIRNAFIGDGSNALLGLKWFYGIRSSIQFTATPAHVSLGNVAFTDVPSFPVAREEFVNFDMGSVVVPQFYGDYRDWSATNYQIYLPFIGIVDLLPQDVVGKTLYLKYWINISDGSAVCTLSTTPSTPNGAGTIFTTTCSWGYDIPVRADSYMDAIARISKITLGAVPFVGDSIGGASSYSTGDLSPNSNVMGDFQAKLLIHRKDDLSGAAFADADGLPGIGTTTVGSTSGYLKVADVYNAGSLAMRHSGEIIAMLKEGIYI